MSIVHHNPMLVTVADTAAVLFESNIVLLNEQLGTEIDTRLFKIGDGVTAWNDLPYATLNRVQNVWMGNSEEAGNLLSRSQQDGGMFLPESFFPSNTVLAAALSTTAQHRPKESGETETNHAFYQLAVVVKNLVMSLGEDYQTLLSRPTSLSVTTVQDRIQSAINGQIGIADIIDDLAESTAKTYSSTKIGQIVTVAVRDAIAALVGAAPEALDTIYELAARVADNIDVLDGIAADLANVVRYNTAQTLTDPQKAQARANIDAASATFVGNFGSETLAALVAARLGTTIGADPVSFIGQVKEALGVICVHLVSNRDRVNLIYRQSHADLHHVELSDYDPVTGLYLTATYYGLKTSNYTPTPSEITMVSKLTIGANSLPVSRQEVYSIAPVGTVNYQLTFDDSRNLIRESIVT